MILSDALILPVFQLQTQQVKDVTNRSDIQGDQKSSHYRESSLNRVKIRH